MVSPSALRWAIGLVFLLLAVGGCKKDDSPELIELRKIRKAVEIMAQRSTALSGFQ